MKLQDLLLSQGASCSSAGSVLHFEGSDQELRHAQQSAGICQLDKVEHFLLTAPDVRRWCNGMFTNNIRKLRPGQGNRSAICDDRGRVQGLADLYCLDEQLFLCVLDGVDQTWFESRFGMFMMLDDIEAEDNPADVLLSIQGPNSAQVLESMGLPCPEKPGVLLCHEQLYICNKERSGLGGFDIFVPANQAAALWQQACNNGASPLGSTALDGLRILAGRARWPQDGTKKSMIHELAINEECCAFDKGCYVGQEIINRIDVKGLINKKLIRVTLTAAAPIGSIISLNGKQVGSLSSLTVIEEKYFGLSVLKKSAWEPGTSLEVHNEEEKIPACVS